MSTVSRKLSGNNWMFLILPESFLFIFFYTKDSVFILKMKQ